MAFDFGAAGLGSGLLGSIFGIATGFHQNHLAGEIHPVWKQYMESKYAKDQLGIANQLFNGRMPGAGTIEQGIDNSQANYLETVNRNATDSSQALALASLSQGKADEDYSHLGVKEGEYKASMLDNLNKALGVMVNEGDKSYQSMIQKYIMDTQTQNALRGNGAQNIVGGFNNAGSNIISYGNYKNSQG